MTVLMTRFPGGLATLYPTGDDAIEWLGMQCKRQEDFYTLFRMFVSAKPILQLPRFPL